MLPGYFHGSVTSLRVLGFFCPFVFEIQAIPCQSQFGGRAPWQSQLK